jgi:hypothetical protein
VSRRRKSPDDRDLTVAEAAGVDNDDSILENLKRIRPSVYGPPTPAMRQRDLDRIVRRR